MDINIATKLYPENRQNGIMICGYNWGGSPDDTHEPENLSFFSNHSTNNYPYRNRILEWFRLWGHPLSTSEPDAFEKSIIQTNWCPSQSMNMGNNEFDSCIMYKENFLFHLEEFRPKIIIFMGIRLLDALNHPDCIETARTVIGNENPVSYHTKTITINGKILKKFKVGFQQFEKCKVIACPHPTGSKGLHYEYIKAFSADISPILNDYKKNLIAGIFTEGRLELSPEV